MKAPGSGVKLTYDDFVQFPDDGRRHELIDGEHYVTPSSNTLKSSCCRSVRYRAVPSVTVTFNDTTSTPARNDGGAWREGGC